MTERDRMLKEIADRVRPTFLTRFDDNGHTIEGRIQRDDLDLLIALARAPGGPIPPGAAAILSRRRI
jgi:hypothetical protein